MTDQIMFWATVLSPIVGVVAIIVALIIAHGSSKDVQSQIKAIRDQIDVFIAAQNPNMLVSKHQYEQQLKQLNLQIHDAENDVNTVYYPFYGRGFKMDDLQADLDKQKRKEKLNCLLKEREEVESRLESINEYLSKAAK